MRVKVKCIEAYWDVELYPNANDPNKVIPIGFEWVVDKERADYLVGRGLVEIVQIEKEEKTQENKKIPTKKVEKK